VEDLGDRRVAFDEQSEIVALVDQLSVGDDAF